VPRFSYNRHECKVPNPVDEQLHHTLARESLGKASEQGINRGNRVEDQPRLFARFNYLFVFVVPYFGSNPQFFAFYNSFGYYLFQSNTDFFFVSINRGTVDMTVTHFYRCFHCLRNGFGIVIVRAERSQPITGILSPV